MFLNEILKFGIVLGVQNSSTDRTEFLCTLTQVSGLFTSYISRVYWSRLKFQNWYITITQIPGFHVGTQSVGLSAPGRFHEVADHLSESFRIANTWHSLTEFSTWLILLRVLILYSDKMPGFHTKLCIFCKMRFGCIPLMTIKYRDLNKHHLFSPRNNSE